MHTHTQKVYRNTHQNDNFLCSILPEKRETNVRVFDTENRNLIHAIFAHLVLSAERIYLTLSTTLALTYKIHFLFNVSNDNDGCK